MTWEKALHAFENEGCQITLDREEIINNALMIKQNFFLNVNNLIGDCCKKKLTDFLPLNFPIMQIEKDGSTILINVQDLILDSNLFEILLASDDPPVDIPLHEPNQDTHNLPPIVYGPKNKPGRKPLYQKFPTLLDCATDFIKSHSFQAHNRRRETTGTGTGVSLKDLQKHLFENVPDLREHGISRDTIHHLKVAPRKSGLKATRYKSLIDAKVSQKRNNYRENSPNQHFLFSRVAYREEFAAMFSHEVKLCRRHE
jgi:hypothetical protein